MPSPIIRKMFLAPRNLFGVQSAIVSLLAGDVFRWGPVRSRLYLFRLIYYLNALGALPTAFRAWRNRKRDLKVSLEET